METLFLLAHPIRWRIIEILASGEHAAGQIADAVQSERGIGREGISKHLNRLARAGLVTTRIDQNARVYRLSPRVIGAIAGLVDHLLALRVPSFYDELDLDGREIDMHDAEAPLTLVEDDEGGCWCIRKAREIRAI
ncbi:MAG: ArsR/SmtB family transcription factor [Microcella sp.]